MNIYSGKGDGVSISIEKLLAQLSDESPEHHIIKVNDELRRGKEEAYGPTTVAIGPYHRGKANLQPMEEHKLWYLKQLLKRRGDDSVNRYVTALKELEKRAREYYAEPISLDTKQFVEMMLVDGCFIVELFRRKKSLNNWDLDPIYRSSIILLGVQRDLILLENQIPFFVLVLLFSMTKDPSSQDDDDDGDDELIHLTLSFLRAVMPNKNSEAPHKIPVDCIKHLLDLVHYSQYYSFARIDYGYGDENNMETSRWEFISSATELQEAGVQFKMVEGRNLFDIRYINGVLEVPPLHIHDTTESHLRNLIAYEQSLPNYPHAKYFSNYIAFMAFLVKSSRDVQILYQNGIIESFVTDDEMVYSILNKGADNIMISDRRDFWYLKVFRALNQHCSRRRNVWMANLRRNYFNSPWALISFLAAVIALLLTIVQTIFSILSVTKSKTI